MTKSIFKIYVLLVLSLSFLSQYFSSPILRSLDDIVFSINLIAVIFFYGKLSIKNSGYIVFVLPILILASALWGFIGGNKAEVILLALRQFKNVFLLVAISPLIKKDFVFIHKTLHLCLWLSIPLAIYQFLYLDHWDKISGFFGSGASGTLSLLILIFVFSEVLYRLANKKKIPGLYLILLTPILLNETKVSFLLIPCLLLISYHVAGQLKLKNVFFGAIVFFIFAISADGVYRNVYGHAFTSFLEAEKLEGYLMAGDGLYVTDDNEIDIGRALRIKIAFEKISSDGISTLLFGYGLGSTFVGTASGLYGIEAYKNIGGGLNIGSRIQIYQMLMEFGIIGSLIIIATLMVFYVKIKSRPCIDRVDAMAIISISTALAGIFYQNILISRELSFLIFCSIYMATINKTSYKAKVAIHS